VRLTVGGAKGKALSDKTQKLEEFFADSELKEGEAITLVFKDLGL